MTYGENLWQCRGLENEPPLSPYTDSYSIAGKRFMELYAWPMLEYVRHLNIFSPLGNYSLVLKHSHTRRIRVLQ